MKKVLPKKARILIASSLVVVFLAVVVLSVSLVFSSITYSQKLGTQFNMSYKAPIRTASYPQSYVGDELNEVLENLYSSGNSALKKGGRYTSGVGNGTYNEYRYQGEWYVRVPSAAKNSVWLNRTIDKYNLTSGIVAGNTYWFIVEPIGNMILFRSKYSNGGDDNPGLWDNCELHNFMNTTFRDEARYNGSRSYNAKIYTWDEEYEELYCLRDGTDYYDTGLGNARVASDFARALGVSVWTSYTTTINGYQEGTSTYWTYYSIEDSNIRNNFLAAVAINPDGTKEYARYDSSYGVSV